jgi:hypothetical protein
MFQGFYITTENVFGNKIDPYPDSWEGEIAKDTPLVLLYFDEHCMEFMDGERDKNGKYREFRLEKPCPIVSAASCHFCGKIVKTNDLSNHFNTDENCIRIRNMDID